MPEDDSIPIPTESLRLVIALIDNELDRLEQSMRSSGDWFAHGDPWPEQGSPSELRLGPCRRAHHQ